MTTIIRPAALACLVLWLSACTIAPTPPGGAPVVDRSSYRAPPPPPAPTVEVRPLPRPEPIITEQPVGPLVPENPYADYTPPAASAPAPIPAPSPPPAQMQRQGNQAVVALLDDAANFVSGGQYDKAAASLERALRIDPRNAGIWHDLGQIKLHQRDFQQAESMFSKSNSLAGNNQSLKARNWRLIGVARRSVGDVNGADAAEAQAVALGG